MLLIGYSIPVSAETINIPDYGVNAWGVANNDNSTMFDFYFSPFADSGDGIYHDLTGVSTYTVHLEFIPVLDYFVLRGKPTTIYINKIQMGVSTTSNDWFFQPQNISVLITYSDGITEYIRDLSAKNVRQTFDIDFSVTPDRNISKLEVIGTYYFSQSFNIRAYLGDHFSAKYDIVVDQESQESGLLKDILEWFKSLFNKVTEGFDNIGDWLSDTFNKITEGFNNIGTWFAELPKKIWDLISEGLKTLFVPDDEYLETYKDKFDNLLEQRFGAVYQSVDVLHDFFKSLQVNSDDFVFELPEVDLSSVGIPFKFGGYQFSFTELSVPFELLIYGVRLLGNFLVVTAFISGLRKRYDEVFGG